MADETTRMAREQLIDAGFADVTLFIDTPPGPEAANPSTAAA
jgi:hypothetical protein